MEAETVPEALDDFSNNATIHGAPRSVGSKTKCSCVWWGLVFCLALGAFGYQFGCLVVDYFDYPTSVSLEYEVENAKFPWVTVCSANPFSYVAVELDRTLLTRTTSYNFDIVNLLKGLMEMFRSNDAFNFLDATLETATQYKNLPLNSFFGEELILNYTHKLEQFIVLCKFKGKRCNVTSVFENYYHPRYYNCSTFRHENEKASDGMENGLSFVLFNNIGTTNPLNHVVRELRSESPDGMYFNPMDDLSGSLLVVHAPNTLPNFEKDGISILSGRHVKVKTQSFLATRQRTPKKKCTKSNRTIDGVEIRETLHICQQVCMQKAIISKCDCYDPDLIPPENAQTNPCMSDFYEKVKTVNESCKDQVTQKCEDVINSFYQYSQCSNVHRFVFNYAVCDCHQPCEELTYVTSTTNDPWPQTIVNSEDVRRYGVISEIFNRHFVDQFTDGEWDLLQKMFWREINQTENVWKNIVLDRQRDILSNFALVEVYFADTNVQVSKEERSYGFVKLLADMGGTLGLWIGMSVISAVEIFYLFVSLIRVCCKRNGRKIKVKTASA